jgi:hypothetical protein
MSELERARSIGLSAKGLANIPQNNYANDFTVYAANRPDVCPSSIAEFLSPVGSALRQNDPTFHEYHLKNINACNTAI